jgi:RNA polymerase sigma-70 factor (ECF subfamily)
MAFEAVTPSDDDLIAQAKRGDSLAFGQLTQRYQDQVYTLACRTLGDRSRALDAAQEAFVRAWRALSSFQGNSRFSSWLYRITLNCCYSELRRRGVPADAMPSQDMDAGLSSATAASFVPTLEKQDLVERLLKQLPPLYRSIVVLHYLQGLDLSEISEITGRPVGTIKAYLHRARQKLRTAADVLLAGDRMNRRNIRDRAS